MFIKIKYITLGFVLLFSQSFLMANEVLSLQGKAEQDTMKYKHLIEDEVYMEMVHKCNITPAFYPDVFDELNPKFLEYTKTDSTVWVHYYYAILTTLVPVYEVKLSTKEIVRRCNAAEVLAEKMEALEDLDEAQFLTIKAMIAFAWIKEGEALASLSFMAKALLKEAMEMAPQDPRIYYLLALDVYYGSPSVSGGYENSIPYFEATKALLKIEKASIKDMSKRVEPYWGINGTRKYLRLCGFEKARKFYELYV